jgi:hypothetical protein
MHDARRALMHAVLDHLAIRKISSSWVSGGP